MKKQNTLFVTSIYSRLWGTEYGGRPSREAHYKLSLLNLLNLNPNKVICYTSKEEFDGLKNYFHKENNISESLLDIRIFELKKSKHFKKIQTLKDLEFMKTSDRCFEIQYNKFFWVEKLEEECKEFDKVYWFDAGLSHGGMFPDEYATGFGYERNFKITLFNENFLSKINKMTDKKFLMVGKNNTGAFYWSRTIPTNYYNEFDNSIHIIGGFFGGKYEDFKGIIKKFEKLLKVLLDNEQELFMEEQIMSCLYFNYQEDFTLLTFDDWYQKENHDESVKFFFDMFLNKEHRIFKTFNKSTNENTDIINVEGKTEVKKINKKKNKEEISSKVKKSKICVSSICIQVNNNDKNYLEHGKIMTNSFLKNTEYDVVIVTNNVDYFSDLTDSRVKVFDYYEHFDEPVTSGNKFNYHLKRQAIRMGQMLGYDIIYYNDTDCYIEGWDGDSFLKKCSQDFDVAFVKHANPQLGGLRKAYKHFQDKIDTEFVGLYYDELDNAPNPAETSVIFKNNPKLKKFLKFWDKISKNNKNYLTYFDGVYFGTSAIDAKMKMTGIDTDCKFTEYSRISHGDRLLNFFGHTINQN